MLQFSFNPDGRSFAVNGNGERRAIVWTVVKDRKSRLVIFSFLPFGEKYTALLRDGKPTRIQSGAHYSTGAFKEQEKRGEKIHCSLP